MTRIVMPDTEKPQSFVDRVLRDAFEQGASDLYWIPHKQGVYVRQRIDGKHEDVASLSKEHGAMCVSRLKVIAGLLTYRTSSSQDGSIRIVTSSCEAEVRVSVMPTSHGERVALRFLNDSRKPSRIKDLGFLPVVSETLIDILRRPTGLTVLTGPTGSGKTTTIYALIRELLARENDPSSIVTIEDPIECEIDGVSQTSVSNTASWGYADALRASLRQDVKTIVVGEMRDREVVAVTLDAALSGHRVITTYHAGDIASVYARILHHGFEPFLVASALSGVFAQRLVRKGDGDGRLPVGAALVMNDEWREFIAAGPDLTKIRKKVEATRNASMGGVAKEMLNLGLIDRLPDL